MNWNTGVLTWNSALVENDSVAYTVDYGDSDKIFPDLPRDDLFKLTSFPRIGIELISISTKPLGLGGESHISDILFTIAVWVSANKDSSVSSGIWGLKDLSSIFS